MIIQNEYFFDKGKLIFLNLGKQIKIHGQHAKLDHSKLESGSEGHYYFENEKLLDSKLTYKEHYKAKQIKVMNFLDAR